MRELKMRTKTYKGFNKDMTCRGFQFEEGKEYKHEGKVSACNSGFHSCENPIDILGYYSPAESCYHETEIWGKTDKNNDDSKIASEYIKIGGELSIKAMVEGAFKFVFERCKIVKGGSATGDNSASQATGDKSASQATGYKSASQATGDNSASQATGDKSASQATGYNSASQATGYNSASQATGYNSASQATGDKSASQATGYKSASLTNGYESVSSIENTKEITSKDAFAIGVGISNKAKAPLGCWLVLAEWKQDKDYNWILKDVKTVKVDGKKIKPDTWYALKGGKFVKS
jgi:hypothetical protein